jgi:hypothetical protein
LTGGLSDSTCDVAKRRKPPRSQPPQHRAPPAKSGTAPPLTTEQRLDEAAGLATASESAVRRSLGTGSEPSPIDQAFAAVEDEIASAERKIRRPGIVARLRAWATSRRRRKQSARLARTFEQTANADHTSSALLAVLTERIARLQDGAVTGPELAEAIEQAAQIAARYDRDLLALDRRREPLRDKVELWTTHTATATRCGRPDLASEAQAVVDRHRRDLADLEYIIEDCNAGQRRIRDAITQLEALAQRSVQAGTAPVSPRPRRA